MKVSAVTLLLLGLVALVFASSCSYGDYDLSGMTIKGSNYYSIVVDGVYYQLNICGAVNNPDCNSIPEPAACQKINGPFYALGSATQQTVGPLPTAGYGASVTYGDGLACLGGVPRVTNINVYCDIYAGQGKILSVVENPTCVYNFNMTSIFACPVYNPNPNFEQL